MIFRNPSGAPELACDACGCRWFDRMTDRCYECGEPVSAEAKASFAQALIEWQREIEAGHAGTGDERKQVAPRVE